MWGYSSTKEDPIRCLLDSVEGRYFGRMNQHEEPQT